MLANNNNNSLNFPATSFMNLFKAITYNSEQTPNKIMDIWDAWEIAPFYKDQLKYFYLYKVKQGDTWVSLANTYYNDQRLWWLIPLFNDIENPFIVMDQELLIQNVKEVKILDKSYVDQILLQARQNKITNDRIGDVN